MERLKVEHHMTWRVTTLIRLPDLTSPHNQPHYFISPRNRPHDIITHHITAHYITITERLEAVWHKKHSISKFFFWFMIYRFVPFLKLPPLARPGTTFTENLEFCTCNWWTCGPECFKPSQTTGQMFNVYLNVSMKVIESWACGTAPTSLSLMWSFCNLSCAAFPQEHAAWSPLAASDVPWPHRSRRRIT